MDLWTLAGAEPSVCHNALGTGPMPTNETRSHAPNPKSISDFSSNGIIQHGCDGGDDIDLYVVYTGYFFNPRFHFLNQGINIF